MTLQERIKASAEELGRLLRDAEKEHQEFLKRRDVRIRFGVLKRINIKEDAMLSVSFERRGHTGWQSLDPQREDTPGGAQSHCNDTEADGRFDHRYRPPYQGFQPSFEHVRRSENLMSKEEASLGFLDMLIRESIQVIPLELVRIDKPAIVLVKVPDTGEENRYMMTLSPIAKS